MKKAILAGLCFMLVSLMMVNGTFAMPDWNKVVEGLNEAFQDLTNLFDEQGKPQLGGSEVKVSLVSDSPMQQLYPGGSAFSETAVRNDGTDPVYFRLVYAIQYDEISWNKLDIDFVANEAYYDKEVNWLDTTIDGTPYKLAVFTYKSALDTGITAPAVKITINMDFGFTTEEINRLRPDFLRTQVLAIETGLFAGMTAEEALNHALPLSNFHPF